MLPTLLRAIKTEIWALSLVSSKGPSRTKVIQSIPATATRC